MPESPTHDLSSPTPAAPVQKQKYLISGASGMIGTALVRSWTADPIHVLQLVRREIGKSTQSETGNRIFWDPQATPAIPDLDCLNGVVAAVHLSGANIAGSRWTADYKQKIVSSRIQSTTALSQALCRIRPLPRVLVCASATGIYGDRGEETLDEQSPPGTGFLAETCVAWEAATRAAEEAGIRVVHARFGVSLSPKMGALAKMLPLFRLGLGGKLSDGRAWMPWVTLRDVVRILRFCLQNEAICGPLNVSSPNAVTNAEFTRALGAAVHRPAILPAPAFALRLAIGEMADQALLASARVLPAKLEKAGYQFADPEIASALKSMLARP